MSKAGLFDDGIETTGLECTGWTGSVGKKLIGSEESDKEMLVRMEVFA